MPRTIAYSLLLIFYNIRGLSTNFLVKRDSKQKRIEYVQDKIYVKVIVKGKTGTNV